MVTGNADALEAVMSKLQMLQDSNRELREQLNETKDVQMKSRDHGSV